MNLLKSAKGRIFLILLIGISLIKCKKDDVEEQEGDPNTVLKRQIVENYASMAYQNYNDALVTAHKLKTTIDAFVMAPSAATHNAAKTSWLKARESYGQTEAFRFSGGPIDVNGPEGLLNAWPLDENFIDYTRDDLRAGIINDSAGVPVINEEVITSLNEKDNGDKNISIGYHAIEFLLWGQDDPDTELKTPGNRPYTDYISGATGTASNQKRRGEYLQKLAILLIKHLEIVKKEWNPTIVANYRTAFLGFKSDIALKNVLTGIGVFSNGELAGERIFAALRHKDQEDEHSCFSDNTHRDIYLNALGVQNVFLGTYTKTDGSIVSGQSIYNLLLKVSPNIAKDLKVQIENSVANINTIPVPFDFALTKENIGDNGPIERSALSLQKQGDLIRQSAAELGYTISVELPED